MPGVMAGIQGWIVLPWAPRMKGVTNFKEDF